MFDLPKSFHSLIIFLTFWPNNALQTFDPLFLYLLFIIDYYYDDGLSNQKQFSICFLLPFFQKILDPV